MSDRRVEVHVCYSSELAESLPPKKFKNQKNKNQRTCKCKKTINEEKAKKWVENGKAEWVISYDGPVPCYDYGKICLIGKAKRTPRSATIEKSHIERAYVVGREDEKERIEEYGRLCAEVWKKLLVFVEEKQFDKDKKENLGRAILWTFGEDRTAGGIGKYNLDREKK